MTDEEIVIRELSNAINSMNVCIPYLEGMSGKIPTEVLNKLDDINRLSCMF